MGILVLSALDDLFEIRLLNVSHQPLQQFLISFAGSGQELEAVPNAFIDVNRGAHADMLHYYYQLNVFITCYLMLIESLVEEISGLAWLSRLP